MIKTIQLKFGSFPGQAALTFEPGHLTVFVGPNNSGKSLLLREIEYSILHAGDRKGVNKIVQQVEERRLDENEVQKILLDERELLGPNIQVNETTGSLSIFNPISKLSGGIDEILRQPPEVIKNNLEKISRVLIFHSTVRLDGHTRLSITAPAPVNDLQKTPHGVLNALLRNDGARERLRQLTYDAFGLYFIIDPSRMQHLRAGMSNLPPQDLERSLSDKALEFFRQANDIAEFSDGVKAFTGLVAAVLCSHYLVMLIDEPEAFLHPPLVRKLGRRLAELSSERGGNVLASTHSPDFLMGCVQAGKGVNIVRLTYRRGAPTARLLAADRLRELMCNPFLRSSGVLSALFYEGAVVCEADTDRAFYQEINERLLEGGGGIDNCVFLNSNGKDTVQQIVRPLREMGIPAAAVVDLDIIKPGTLKPLLQAAFVPPPLVDTLNTLKDKTHSAFKATGRNPKDTGLEALDPSDKETAAALINYLSEYGIFVVPVGEVERWLPELHAAGHGPRWLTQAFTKMGNDPDAPNYLKPSEGDVWDFVRRMAVWITNPERKGLP